MVGTIYKRTAEEVETAEVEAVNAVAAGALETVEIPRMGTQGVSLPLRTLHTRKTVTTHVFSFPAKRVTIENVRVITVDATALEADEVTRPVADEVDERV